MYIQEGENARHKLQLFINETVWNVNYNAGKTYDLVDVYIIT